MSTKKAEARERVKAMREEQARKDRARERMMRLSIAVAVLVGVAIIAVAVISNQGGGDDGPVAVPAAAESQEEGSGILVGDAGAPVTIDYWMDFGCPHCQEFEAANGATIKQLVDSGQANIVYHPVEWTGGASSRHANNAFACAAAEGQASEFKDAAFTNFSQQWTNNQLVDLGEQIGIGGDFESCVRDETYEDWSASVTDAAGDAEVEGTPTVFVNDELVDPSNWTPEGLTAAVQAAAGGEADSEPTGGADEPTGEATDGAGDE